ncbi:peptidase M48 [Rhodobacteraceae bacterium 63075]|nr:peptidase M48 [Rhodobacteraceae bacterium 63075]
MPEAAGQYFDGASAAKHKVTARLDEARGLLVFEGETLSAPEEWPLDELRLLADQPGGGWLTFTLLHDSDDETSHHEARLSIADGAMNARLRQLAPTLTRRDVRRGTGGRVLTYVIGAAAAVALMLFVILPAMAGSLAYLMPRDTEVAFGKAVVRQMTWFLSGDAQADLTCRNPEGRAALETMTARLTGGVEMDYALEIEVFDHEMVNAFAAPGGQIVLMRGLIEQASGPEAVAGVLAHEIGHVENRDATRNALRTAGSAGLLSMVFGDFSGGTIAVVLAEQMLNAGYTREAEREADDFALEAMRRAGVDSAGLASFFEFIMEKQGDVPEGLGYFMSHPPSDARAEKALRVAEEQGETTPVLSAAEWQALQDICAG